jgi:acetylornithine deacetylase
VPASGHAAGQESSSYPARCLPRGERRTIPGETARVEGELRELLGGVDGDVRIVVSREPLETPPDAPIAELVARYAGAPEVVGVPFWADSALLSAAGIPTVVFGPAGEGAHAVEEWVDLASAERCAEVYAAVARELCA